MIPASNFATNLQIYQNTVLNWLESVTLLDWIMHSHVRPLLNPCLYTVNIYQAIGPTTAGGWRVVRPTLNFFPIWSVLFTISMLTGLGGATYLLRLFLAGNFRHSELRHFGFARASGHQVGKPGDTIHGLRQFSRTQRNPTETKSRPNRCR